MVVEGRAAEEYDPWEFIRGYFGAEGAKGGDKGFGGVLSDSKVGDINAVADDGEDDIGGSNTGSYKGDVFYTAFKDMHVPMAFKIGEEAEQLGLGTNIYIDSGLGVFEQ